MGCQGYQHEGRWQVVDQVGQGGGERCHRQHPEQPAVIRDQRADEIADLSVT